MNDSEDGGTMNDRKTRIEEDRIPLMNGNVRLSVRDYICCTPFQPQRLLHLASHAHMRQKPKTVVSIAIHMVQELATHNTYILGHICGRLLPLPHMS